MDNYKLLFHIAYYSNSVERLDSKNNVDKSHIEYTEYVLLKIKHFLEEINNYNNFKQIDVVLDVNIENDDVTKINKKLYNNLNLTINYYSFKDEHPFRLTTKHRISMKNRIKDYDWFGYSEDDTIIYRDTINFLLNNSDKLFDFEQKVYTIPRLVYDTNNNYFFSDIIKPSYIINSINGKALIPSNRFGACWFYSKKIMNKWIQNSSFLKFNYPNICGGIRVKMGLGFTEKIAIIPINNKNEPAINSIHLGYSGKYYFIHPKGFHTLSINNIVKNK